MSITGELNYITYLEFVTHFDLSEKMKGIVAAKKSVLKRADQMSK